MIVKNNYNECLTNLACSIRKYFELNYTHKTLPYIDELLEKEQPENVVIVLYDGMGSKIIDRHLNKSDFFIKNRYKEITTVFPATTTAATTSIRTGYNPIEHGWLGWNTFFKSIGKTVTLFEDKEKETKKEIPNIKREKEKYLITKTITNEINEKGKFRAIDILPFGDNPYSDLDSMLEIIIKETKKPGKKFIYAYDMNPDHTMHIEGPDSKKVHNLIKERNNKTEKMCENIKDTIVIVIADHGHVKVDNIFLKDYPDVTKTFERTTSIEPRATSFKIKDGMKEEFEEKFNNHFKDYYDLYTKKEVKESQLFGDGKENKLFEEALGDYIAIAKTNKILIYQDDNILFSQHAGYLDDEIYVPLIIKKC